MIKSEKLKEWYFSQPNSSQNTITRILDVEYAHIKLPDESDLYVTDLGMPFLQQLMPENYYTDEKWYKSNAQRLSGTSCVYRVRTKEIDGKSKELVLKWNRMGQEIPGGHDNNEFDGVRFNSPFEEFCLVMELRNAMYDSSFVHHIIHKPLAIYVPFEKSDLDRMGRRKYKMEKVISEHLEIEIDMNRSYTVIYEWIKGIDLVESHKRGLIDTALMEKLTMISNKNMKACGYIVRDYKPHHLIVRPYKDQKKLVCRNDNFPINALIDFELLERTSDHSIKITKSKRLDYHKRQTKRFVHSWDATFHPHLHQVNFLGVDYIYGKVESTKGRLWTVGADPYLFDYFLPERWERKTKHTKISPYSDSFYTITKDNIHIVWKVSKVGISPNLDPFKENEKMLIDYGYNSPFEEISLAIELNSKNIPTIYPRAIYMTGFNIDIAESFFDKSRYENHRDFKTPDALPLLHMDHEYIIIWGYWNGPDEMLSKEDITYYKGINALRAFRERYISEDKYMHVLKTIKKRLRKVGIQDMNLCGSHLLLSLDKQEAIVYDSNGVPEVRICNFEFLKKITPYAPQKLI